ncbi:unnamed protein product, partial [Sphacelaria rigidula]
HYLQGKYDESAVLCERALTIRRGALGEDHEDTAGTRRLLDDMRREQIRS